MTQLCYCRAGVECENGAFFSGLYSDLPLRLLPRSPGRSCPCEEAPFGSKPQAGSSKAMDSGALGAGSSVCLPQEPFCSRLGDSCKVAKDPTREVYVCSDVCAWFAVGTESDVHLGF